MPIQPSPAVFIAAHPDDETLAMSVAIAEHLAAGQDVHVLWLTDGTASGVRSKLNGAGTATWWGVLHDPAAEGYAPLTEADLGEARVREGTNALKALATGYSGTLTIHRAGLLDGSVTQAQAEAAIVALADQIAPGGPIRVKTHTWVPQLDAHPDHIAAGAAAKALAASDPTRFGDVRYYILPPYWTDPDLTLVVEAWDNPTDAGITARVRNAIKAYGAWAPPETYAVGWHSVPDMFTTLQTTPKCLFHS